MRHLKKTIAQLIGCMYIILMIRRDVFQAIADPKRRAIINIIALNAKTPNAIAEHFQISRQAVSKHLRILFESGLVDQKQVGREIYFRVQPSGLKELDAFIEPLRKLWEKRFVQLDDLLKQMEDKNEPENGNKKRLRI